MTRRHLVELLLTGAADMYSCAPSNARVLSRLNQTLVADDLAMIDILVPEAINVIGPNAGRLVLPEPPDRIALAPDGAWIAWFPYPNSVIAERPGGPPVYFTDDARSARELTLRARFARELAISSEARHLAVAMIAGTELITRLVVLKPDTGEIEHDVTDLITRFNVKDLERLRLSAKGDRIAAGSRDRFSVINLPSHKVVFEAQGRFPTLSPSGDRVAFIDSHRKLNLTTIATGATRRLLEHSITHGVGSWTPDGTLLLAGVEGPLSFFWYLSAIDCERDACASIARLEEHDSGQECSLIKRRLLTREPGSAG